MKKFLFILLAIYSLNFAYELKLNSNVTALKFNDGVLYIGTDKGELLGYDLATQELKKKFVLPKIKNYYGDELDSRIYSIDVLDDAVLILSEANYGKKDISIYSKGILHTKTSKHDSANKIFFVDKNTVLLALLGSEIKLLRRSDFVCTATFKFSHSSLNDLKLSEDKTKLVAGFESGEVELFDLINWRIIKNYKDLHKDNVYQVDYKNQTIVSCATDRRVGVVRDHSEKFLQKKFLIYACALSPDGKFAAFSDNNENTTEVIYTSNLEKVVKFKNENIMSEFIIFIDDKNIIVSGFGNSILFRSF